MLDRRKLLVDATALAGYSALARAAAPYEWQTISPADAGFVPGFGERLDQFVLGGQAPNIHGVIIVRRGRVVFENYFEGDDQLLKYHSPSIGLGATSTTFRCAQCLLLTALVRNTASRN